MMDAFTTKSKHTISIGLLLSLLQPEILWVSPAHAGLFKEAEKNATCGGVCAPYFIFSGGGSGGDKQQATMRGAMLDGAMNGPSPKPSGCGPNILSFTQMGPNCEAAYLADDAAKLEKRAATFWMAAAAACWTACYQWKYRNITFTIADTTATNSIAAGNGGTCARAAANPAAIATVGTSVAGCEAACGTAVGLTNTATASSKTALGSAYTPGAVAGAEAPLAAGTTAMTDWQAAAASWVTANTACSGYLTDSLTFANTTAAAWTKSVAAATAYKTALAFCITADLAALANDVTSYNSLATDAKEAVKGIETMDMISLVGDAVATATVLKSTTSGDGTIGICGAAGIMTAITGIRYYSMTQAQKTSSKSCKTIKDAMAQNYSSAATSTCPSGPTSPGPQAETNLDLGKAGEQKSRTTKQGVSSNALNAENESMSDFNDPLLEAAATAGPGSDILQNLNKDGIKDVATELGLAPGDIAKKLGEGMSPSAIFATSSSPQLTGLSSTMKGMEDLAAKGQLFQEGAVAGTGYSGAKTGGGAKAPVAFAPPAKPIGAGGKAAEIGFGKPVAKPADPSTDIWHTGYKGSIFSIISTKLDRHRSSVTPLDYAIPFNAVMSTDTQPVTAPPPTTSLQPPAGAVKPAGGVRK